MKENINEHDKTKEMMNIMRGGFKTLIKENDEQSDTLSPQPGDAAFKDELKKLQDTVDPRVKITNFKIYPVDQNVIIEGILLQREGNDSGIHFKMNLAKGDIETSMNNIELDDKVSLVLQKLKGYYENWVNEWALKLANEYRPKQH
jgi:type II secretory pathway component PulC